jgi:separase
MSSCALINASVGGAICRKISRIIDDEESCPIESFEDLLTGGRKESNRIAEIFAAMDLSTAESVECFFAEMADVTPQDWRFVTMALCPTGELLITSVEFSDSRSGIKQTTSCVFPQAGGKSDSATNVFDEVVLPLDGIVQRSQDQLNGVTDVTTANEKFNSTARQREWWEERKEIDSELHDLLNRVDQIYFGSEDAKRVLVGSSSQGSGGLSDSFDSTDIAGENLASRFEAASQDELEPLSAKNRHFGDSVSTAEMPARDVEDFASIGDALCCPCTFLILDENLQRFPFEGLPSLEGKTVCRLPSLPFALAKLVEVSRGGGDFLPSFLPEKTSYVLDPESNLSATTGRLLPLIDSLNHEYGEGWEGVVGEAPGDDFIEKSLSTKDGLLLYFGHGGGQKYISRKCVQSLMRPGLKGPKNASTRQGRASVILMGCSSGRLESVNTKTSKSLKQKPIHYEPEGIALSYLMAGAPCVVGNLWDVTDRDIDRFSVALLEGVFSSDDNRSIAQSVAEARSACKMRYIVGSAPVCYGLPIIACRKRQRATSTP